MKIVILNASPKGNYSVTLQYSLYVLKTMPEDVSYDIINVAKNIKDIERKPELLKQNIEIIKKADCIIWSFPVYIYSVPYQLMKFLDMLEDADSLDIFKDKYTASISSSFHFYDNIAHNYMHATCEDLGMKYIEDYSASMKDMLLEEERAKLKAFGENIVNHIKNDFAVEKIYSQISAVPAYTPDMNAIDQVDKIDTKRVVLLTDSTNKDSNLNRMTNVLKRFLAYPVVEYNLNDLDIKGGCLSCMRCAFIGKCVYNDGFPEFHMNKVMSADVLITAMTLKGRYFSPVWKLFYDRSFYNGHRSTFQGKHTANIVSGSMSDYKDLREILLAVGEIGKQNLIGIVTDEYQDSGYITKLLKSLSDKIVWAVDNNVQKPFTFRGVGGSKIFRDLIYSMKGIMLGDHKFFKKNKLYDFPNKDWKNRIEQIILKTVLTNRRFRIEALKRMDEELIKPYKKFLD